MARVTMKVFPAVYDGDLDINDPSLSGNSKKAVYSDSFSGDKIVLEGKDLTYDVGNLVGGTVNKLSIVDGSGEKFEIIHGFKLDGSLFANSDIIVNFEEILAKIFENDMRVLGTKYGEAVGGWNGDDMIVGRGGDDILGGGYGRDVLVGGAGVDTFVFDDGYGNDRIKDFDAKGGAGFKDLIQADFAEIESIARSGKNTVIDFGDGDTLTLVDIKPNEIDQTDFYNNIDM